MRVLVIAPHPDDEVIGVGGTIAKRAEEGHEVYVCVVTKAFPPLFSEEIVEQARNECREADKSLGVVETSFLDFPAVTLETVPRYELNGGILKTIQRIKPDEVYIPHRGDMQLDHKMIVDAAMVALRPKYDHVVKRIYAYETLSETGWDIPNTTNEFIPTVYVDITHHLNAKIKAMEVFKSQLGEFPDARSIGAIEALARYRGATVNVKAAEAFSLIREIK
jgi:LmbE family N-acetylglucosaminyl deacetylase